MTENFPAEASLGLGGNVGDVVASFIYALRRLGEGPGVTLLRASSVYQTPPWGKLDQPNFLNMAVLVQTASPPRALLRLCLEIEQGRGRRRIERWGPRTLDIDILTYGDAAISEPDLELPHPRIAERAFVLAPLAEIAPQLQIAGQEIAQLLALVDRAGVDIDPEATARMRATLRLGEARAAPKASSKA
jgi:2-amino-4-hydroxy-6-hydroxymethyldihydropteridine diphosphokinase